MTNWRAVGRTLKSVGFWLLVWFVIFLCGLFMAITFEDMAEAKTASPAVASAKCPILVGNVAMCELHGVTQWTAHWETKLGNRVAQHTKGITVYLTLDEQWRDLHIYIITRDRRMDLFNGYIRIKEGKVLFGMQDGDGA